MNESLKKLFLDSLLAYIEMVEIHLDTKTVDKITHELTRDFYELLFNITHEIGERYVDLDGQLRDDHGDCYIQWSKVIEIMSTLRSTLASSLGELSKDPMLVGADNLIRSHIDKLDFSIGNAKGLVKKDSMKESKEIPAAMVVEIETEPKESKLEIKDNNNGSIVDEAVQVIEM